jgi:hypothetical protein
MAFYLVVWLVGLYSQPGYIQWICVFDQDFYIPIRLWALQFEFNIISTCHEILFSTI